MVIPFKCQLPGALAIANTGGYATRTLYAYCNNATVVNNSYGFQFSMSDLSTSVYPILLAAQMFRINAVGIRFTPNFTMNQIAPVTGIATSLNNTQDWYSLVSPDFTTQYNIRASIFTNAVSAICSYNGVKRHQWNKSVFIKSYCRSCLCIGLGDQTSGNINVPNTKKIWLPAANATALHYGITVVFPGLSAANTSQNFWDMTSYYYLSLKGLY